MRDLGRCHELDRLLKDYSAAVDRLRSQLRALSDSAMAREFDFFRDLWQKATNAQRDCADAREKLNRHMSQHGCCGLPAGHRGGSAAS